MSNSRDTSGPDGPDGPDDFDPAAAAAILAGESVVSRRLQVDGAVLFTAWGLAWSLGYLLLWWAARTSDGGAPGWSLAVFFALLVAAGVVTAIHIARRSTGMRGASSQTGTLYGLSWTFSFVAASLLFGGMARHGLDSDQMAVLTNGVSCLVVGILYMVGAALSRERTWFVIGAWIVIVAGLASQLPLPDLYLAMAVAGGGGMLVGAAVTVIARRRSPR